MKENGKTTQIVLPVKELNAYLCCKLCNGYFREAHSISECLHTFCKGCILNHLENQPRGNKKCPICSVELKPHRLIYDRTIQAVVDKLFPHFIYNQHTAATSSMQTASSSSHLNSSSTGAGAGASVQAGGKRARDESAADADEQEEDIAKSDANLAIIRVMPYPISSESDALSSSSSSNELARKQLPPLSKPLLKAVDSVKVSKVQKFIMKRLPDEIAANISSSSQIDIYYKTTRLNPSTSLQAYVKELNIINETADETDVILLYYKLKDD